jgi:transposase
MKRISLSDDQRTTLLALRHDPALPPYGRDRVEMLFLSADAHWSPPAIAKHLGYCTATVRRFFDQFAQRGTAAIRYRPMGPVANRDRHDQIQTALRTLLAQPRTWTAGQLAAALPAQGITLSTRQLRRYLHEVDAGWHRTVRSLAHRQNLAKVAAAEAELAGFKNGRKQGS